MSTVVQTAIISGVVGVVVLIVGVVYMRTWWSATSSDGWPGWARRSVAT